jgi:hypothetical protein
VAARRGAYAQHAASHTAIEQRTALPVAVHHVLRSAVLPATSSQYPLTPSAPHRRPSARPRKL